MPARSDFVNARRIVVKIGSSLLTESGKGLDTSSIAGWVEQMATLRQNGIDILLVSSGSVAEGMCRLGWCVRPQTLHRLQAAASVGQMGLIQTYESYFKTYGLHTAQVLLTHEDLSNRQRYLNARSTLLTLLALGVIPVINENDVVATDEIRFGDNDTLAALVSNLVESDLLIILTDQSGLFERDPSLDPTASVISDIGIKDSRLKDMAGESRSGLGRGGMNTKIRAARLASRSGTPTVIASGREPRIISQITEAKSVGTFLIPDIEPMAARKRWLAGQLQVKGTLTLDPGAIRALELAGKSLLFVGVTRVEGLFKRGDLVSCVDAEGREIARGLVNYTAEESQKLKQQPSSRIKDLLGYEDGPELIHRDNLVLV